MSTGGTKVLRLSIMGNLLIYVIYELSQMIKGSSCFMHDQIQSERSICPGKIGEEGYSCGDEMIYCNAEK